MRGNLRDGLIRWEDRSSAQSENQPINILFGANGLSDGSFSIGTNVRAERKLHEDTADGYIIVEFLDHRDNTLDGRALGESDMIEGDPDILSGLCLHAYVDGRILTRSSLDDRQLGLESWVFRFPRPNLLRNIITERPEMKRKVRRRASEI